MDRKTLALASALLLVAVAFGAFGAHGLKARLTPDALAQWRTGVEYQFYHALGLLVLAVSFRHLPARPLRVVRTLFAAGIGLFSGSLYLLATRELLGTGVITPVLGPITPLGGSLLIAGWAVLLVAALRRADGDHPGDGRKP